MIKAMPYEIRIAGIDFDKAILLLKVQKTIEAITTNGINMYEYEVSITIETVDKKAQKAIFKIEYSLLAGMFNTLL